MAGDNDNNQNNGGNDNNQNNGGRRVAVDHNVDLPASIAAKDREISELKDEIFKLRDSGRSTKAERDDLKTRLDKLEEDKLKEEKKYKDLYEREKEARTSSESTLSKRLLRSEVRSYAVQNGLIDPDMADLIPIDSLVGADDGTLNARIKELVREHAEKKPSWYAKKGGNDADADHQDDEDGQQRQRDAGARMRTPKPGADKGEVDVSKMTRDEYRAYKSRHLKEIQKRYR